VSELWLFAFVVKYFFSLPYCDALHAYYIVS
jgi:hypothetical protein